LNVGGFHRGLPGRRTAVGAALYRKSVCFVLDICSYNASFLIANDTFYYAFISIIAAPHKSTATLATIFNGNDVFDAFTRW
jgi:hypothetical protein